MRIGVCLPQLGPAAAMPLVSDFAIGAERVGFDSLWAQEHLFRPVAPISGYGGVDGARWPEQHRNVLAPMELLAHVAARTDRCTVGTSILVAAYHHPVVLAKRAATIDVLSGGRFALGIGAGWAEDELRLLGREAGERGSVADELLEVMNHCWSGAVPAYQGRHFAVPEAETSPLPTHGSKVPTYGGFVARSTWRRVARWCDVWQPFRLDPESAVGRLAEINRMAVEDYGRPPLGLSLRVLVAPGTRADGDAPTGHWGGAVEEIADRVVAARDAGCDELVIDTGFAAGSERTSYWEELPERLLPLVEAAHG